MEKPNDFWYTPDYVWRAIRAFFGENLFDPCPVDPKFDGLQTSWKRDCYINPPYSKPLRGQFVDKAVEQYAGGRYLWLLNYGNHKDMLKLMQKATAVVVPYKRIKFVPGIPELGNGESPMYDSLFVLWGNFGGFDTAFADIGTVFLRNTMFYEKDWQIPKFLTGGNL